MEMEIIKELAVVWKPYNKKAGFVADCCIYTFGKVEINENAKQGLIGF